MKINSGTEELINTITHGIGVLLSVVALILLTIKAVKFGGAVEIIGAVVFGCSMILLYTASTLYHGAVTPPVKDKLNKFDHSAIYLLIAGSYTPYTLITLQGAWGWSLFGVIWGMALIGILFKIFWYSPKYRVISAWAYVVMGLMVVIAAKPLVERMETMGLIWIVLGGVFYIGGVLFYLPKKLPFGHAIWHLFVLAGSISLFFGVYDYVLPSSIQ